MANTHLFVNTMKCTCWDVDAYNCAGIAEVDIDNGTLVTRGAMAIEDVAPGGFEFHVSLPASNAEHLWIVDTPEVGANIEMQMMDDPRYFYNVAGRPMSLRYLVPEVDFIEIPQSAIAGGAVEKYATVTTSGLYAVANSAPDNGTYFYIAAEHSISIGLEVVPTFILQVKKN